MRIGYDRFRVRPIDLPSAIRDVLVFRRGALIARVASLPCSPQGSRSTVRLVGLPLVLDDDSVRVQVQAEDGTPPCAIEVRVELDVVAPEAETMRGAPSEDDVRAARLAHDRVAARLAEVMADVADLDALGPGARPPGRRGEPPPVAPVSDRMALLALRSQRIERLLAEAAELRMALRRAVEARDDVARRFAQASTARAPRSDELRKAVRITLLGGSATSATIVVQYGVPGARWAPAYDLRIDDRRARLGLRAVVSQASGEDWSGVDVVCSTALPQRWTELRELPSLRIGRVQPAVRKRGFRPPPSGARALYADYDRQCGPAPEAKPMPPSSSLDVPDAPPAYAYDPRPERMPAPASDMMRRSAAMPPPGAPPMPVAFAAPAALPMPAPKRGGGLLGEAAAFVAAPRSRRVESVVPPAAPPPLPAPDEPQLEYTRLRMPAAHEADRGELVVIGHVSMWTETRVDVVAMVRVAVAKAEAVGSDLPVGHVPPDSADGFDHAYRASAPVDVPSDGHWHTIALTSAETEVHRGHVVVPRESTDVFRWAELANPLASPLLPGPVDVHVGDDFLLTSQLRATPSRGRIRVGLGVEPAIVVARNTTFKESAAGLMGGSLSLRHGIGVEVTNNLRGPAEVEVRERVPVLRENESAIEVAVHEASPRWEAYEAAHDEPDLRGGHRWQLRLQPGETQTLKAGYTVEISGKHELVGGNRRE